MKLYVWHNRNWSCGLHVAIADSPEEARELVMQAGVHIEMLKLQPTEYSLTEPVAFSHGCCQQ